MRPRCKNAPHHGVTTHLNTYKQTYRVKIFFNKREKFLLNLVWKSHLICLWECQCKITVYFPTSNHACIFHCTQLYLCIHKKFEPAFVQCILRRLKAIVVSNPLPQCISQDHAQAPPDQEHAIQFQKKIYLVICKQFKLAN